MNEHPFEQLADAINNALEFARGRMDLAIESRNPVDLDIWHKHCAKLMDLQISSMILVAFGQADLTKKE